MWAAVRAEEFAATAASTPSTYFNTTLVINILSCRRFRWQSHLHIGTFQGNLTEQFRPSLTDMDGSLDDRYYTSDTLAIMDAWVPGDFRELSDIGSRKCISYGTTPRGNWSWGKVNRRLRMIGPSFQPTSRMR